MQIIVSIIISIISINCFAIEYSTKELKDITIALTTSHPATYSSLNNSVIKAQINAKVDKIHNDVGDFVKANQTLLTLDCSDYNLAQQAATATLQQAKAGEQLLAWKLQQTSKLFEKQNIALDKYKGIASEYQIALANLNKAKASFNLALLNSNRCNVKADFDGIITQRFISQGDLVSPANPVFKISSTANSEVTADVHFTDIGLLQNSPKIIFKTEAKSYNLKLIKILEVVDNNTKTQKVRFEVLDKTKPKIGAPGRLIWQLPGNYIPAKYIQQQAKHLGVFIVENSKAKFHILKNAIYGRPAKISLALNTLVLDKGRMTVKDGDVISGT